MDKFDYIIAGAGCAGLSLLHYLNQDPILSQKKILVIDRNLKKSNDRTWCFWEKENADYEALKTSSWSTISIHKGKQDIFLPTSPFTYKMIEGFRFYENIISNAKNNQCIQWLEANIVSFRDHQVLWEGGAASATYIFNSIIGYNPVFQDNLSVNQLNTFSKNLKKPFLWQHFKGITIEFDQPILDVSSARLMDFNVEQHEDTAFIYLLPISDKKALVEYTIFSKQIFSKEVYDNHLQLYLKKKYPNQNYQVLHEEFGAIPMTQNALGENATQYIIPIGTNGAAVKASTGYAFKFIQDQAKQIVQSLSKGNKPNAILPKTRHYFYDAVLLDILYNKKMSGEAIFTRIFAKNKAATVFRFLSNTSSIFDDIKIMSSLPTRLFLFTAIRIILRSNK